MSSTERDDFTEEENGKKKKTNKIERTEGSIYISEDVIIELARKTILSIDGIRPVSGGLASKFGIGRKSGDGIRIVVEDGEVPAVSIDTYITVKYGQRIPDLAWEVQEKIKENLESLTGYIVKTINVNVQGIYFKDPPLESESDFEEEES